MSDVLEDQGIRRPQPVLKPYTPLVPWRRKAWKDFTDSDKDGLRHHMTTFEDDYQRESYQKYLVFWCDVPQEWFC